MSALRGPLAGRARALATAAWRAVRGHYMLSLSAAVLVAAAAAGTGAFDRPDAARQRASAPTSTATAVVTPPPVGTPTLVMTFFLVSTPQERDLLRTLERQLIQREWLAKHDSEVLLAGTPAEEQAALETIERARRTLFAQIEVVDLRAPRQE